MSLFHAASEQNSDKHAQRNHLAYEIYVVHVYSTCYSQLRIPDLKYSPNANSRSLCCAIVCLVDFQIVSFPQMVNYFTPRRESTSVPAATVPHLAIVAVKARTVMATSHEVDSYTMLLSDVPSEILSSENVIFLTALFEALETQCHVYPTARHEKRQQNSNSFVGGTSEGRGGTWRVQEDVASLVAGALLSRTYS